jgi:hypothetical protein
MPGIAIGISRVLKGSNVNQNPGAIAAGYLALFFQESNRDYMACPSFLINTPIDTDYKNYLVYKLLINI